MPLYRVFHLNRAGGIARAEIIESLDDQEAIGRVQAAGEDHAVELWDRARFVAKIEATTDTGAATVTRAGGDARMDDQLAKLAP